MIFELVLFLKPELHPPSFTTRSTIHRVMTRLIFVGEVGKWGGNMWLWGAKKLVLWVFYNEKPIWQLRILPLTTLEAADVQLPSTKFSGEVDSGRGNCLSNFFFFGPDGKLLPACPTSKNLLPLHSWRSLIYKSYWVHFTFKVQNPIYIFTSIE